MTTSKPRAISAAREDRIREENAARTLDGASVGPEADVRDLLAQLDHERAELTRVTRGRDLATTRRNDLSRDLDAERASVVERITEHTRGVVAGIAGAMGLDASGEGDAVHARIVAEHERLTRERDNALLQRDYACTERDTACDALERTEAAHTNCGAAIEVLRRERDAAFVEGAEAARASIADALTLRAEQLDAASPAHYLIGSDPEEDIAYGAFGEALRARDELATLALPTRSAQAGDRG